MPLDNKLQRLAVLMEPDVHRMLEKQAQRTGGHDDVRWDERSAHVSFLRKGGVVWQPKAEKIGVWYDELGLFRWWFTGVRVNELPPTRLHHAYREGQRYQVHELTTDPIQLGSVDEAEVVARLAAQLARADGVVRLRDGSDRTIFVALFDTRESARPSDGAELRDTSVNTPSQRPDWLTNNPLEQPSDRAMVFRPAAVGTGGANRPYSVVPPAGRDTVASARAPQASRSIPPVHAVAVSEDDGFSAPAIPQAPRVPGAAVPLPNLPIREPSRALFMPVASAALGDVAAAVDGFGQALVVVRVEVDGAKMRFFVQLTAADAHGDLVSLDPSRGLLDAVSKLIADDARDGNGRWKKLVARLKPTARGASVDVEVA